MKHITDDDINDVLLRVHEQLLARVKKYGTKTHTSPHESLGIITEEYHEFIEAVHGDDDVAMFNESMDIAVAAIWTCLSK